MSLVPRVEQAWRRARLGPLGVAALLALSAAAQAQPDIDIGGLAYVDYSYVLAHPDDAEDGANGFDYRRVYVTTDFTLSERFSGRVRLEANGGSTTAQGRPSPFVKDLFATWSDPLGDGTRLRLGVQPPPVFEVAERVWGYRSLAKTLLDRTDVNDSRDFGLRADVPLGGPLRFAAMFANGNGVRPEPDGRSGKHLYGQLQVLPSDSPLRATLGAGYQTLDDADDPRDAVLKTSAFIGATTAQFRAGVEAFYLRNDFPDIDPGTSRDGLGLSVFGAVNFGAADFGAPYSVVGRYDFVDDDAGTFNGDESYALAAFVYRPHRLVELMPNVVLSNLQDEGTVATGRFTLHVRF